ncbi:hypothetical protein [Antrihabitans spumae]|uniref:Uncharacterized protein n=1 Tax=Antrihabitans spumae TaxID=3373370 RepID=A0ABW7JN04_9NOCA
MATEPDSTRPPVLLVGATILFVVGVCAIGAMFVVAAVTSDAPPDALYAATLAAPLGLLLAVVYALQSGRRSRNKK